MALCSLALVPLRTTLVLREAALVYLLGIVLVASRTSRTPTFVATILSVLAFDVLFVPPVGFFSFLNPRLLLADAVMFLVAHITSRLTLRIREQGAAALRRERQTATLYSLSRELAGGTGTAALSEVAVRHVEEALPVRADVVLGEEPADGPGGESLRLPLRTASRTLGHLRVTPAQGAPRLDAAATNLLESFAGQIAMALERTSLVEEARRAALAAEREAMRGTLLSSISHDLRTPLAAVVGAASALQEGNGALTAAARGELLQTVVEESEHLDRIVRNVLALTQVESAMAPLRAELQSVEELVGAAVERLGGRLEGRRLEIAIPDDLPLVPCDPILIGLVVTNLLENALKYTPAGGPLELAAREEGAAVHVELRDRGPGIRPGEEERIFEKFTRGAGQAGGLGLGLAICRAIVAAHGGSIQATRRPGGGAVFSFSLPTQPSDLPAGAGAGGGR